jgi:signal transduction histidine kinase
MLKPAITEAERLERLVNDLLTYGRPPTAVPAVVDWRNTAANLIMHGKQMIGSRPISLVIPEREFLWRSDPEILEHILLNLMRNSIEAIPPGKPGEVRIELDTNTGDVTISVLDNGSGLPPGDMDRLFEPFFTTKASGTGLAISRSLVSALGGELKLLPRAGGGTAALICFRQVALQTAGVPV